MEVYSLFVNTSVLAKHFYGCCTFVLSNENTKSILGRFRKEQETHIHAVTAKLNKRQ